LDGEQFVRFTLLTRTRGKRCQRLTVAIDAGDPAEGYVASAGG
jgi:hypothetical protein